LAPTTTDPKPRICLVSCSHVSTNPRLVKEADALQEAGYAVHVVAGRNYAPSDKFDAVIFERAKWTYTVVNFGSGPRAVAQKIIRKLARLIVARTARAPLWLVARAYHAAVAQIADAAARVPAQLYIGHTLAGLIAAAYAAQRNRTRLGFDAEDFHAQETVEIMNDPGEQAIVRRLEHTLLPRCVHLTAAAPLMAEAYAKTYALRLPITVQNVFPLSETPAEAPAEPTVHQPARFYWFSRTVGAGRGIESIILILAQMKTPTVLTLRGEFFDPNYADNLRQVAREAGYTGELNFQPPENSSEMARLAAKHDVGLAIEPNYPPNRQVCLSNKFYTYLLAGIPIAYTGTRAQCALAAELGAAAMLIDPSEIESSATRLDEWLTDPARYSSSRAAAWSHGRSRFNWDFEKQTLIAAVEASLQR